MDPQHYLLAGRVPQRVVAPDTVEAVREVIRDAPSIVCWGGGTQIGMGCAPQPYHTVLSTERLSAVVDYQPDDMTVTVQPGCTHAQLAQVLAQRGQILPLDPPRPDQATLGGTVAAAVAGPWCAGHGTPRDWLIGLRVQDAAGMEVRGGGQVVKNVAGYDLPKLYTGSFGTLGVITELTFKVMPQAAGVRRARVDFGEGDPEPLLASISDSDLLPSVLSLVRDAGTGSGGWSVLVEFRHVPEGLAWQVEHLRLLAATAGGEVAVLDEPAGEQAYVRLREMPLSTPYACRLSTLPGRVAALAREALQRAPAETRLVAHVPLGHIHLLLPSIDAERCSALRQVAQRHRARCRFPRLPAELLETVDPWGDPGPGGTLMQRIKATLDPENRFSPGRFVGRL